MITIHVESVNNRQVLYTLNKEIMGTISDTYGEQVLAFDNKLGKGTIRSISFDSGISLLDYDVEFNDDVKIAFEISESSPIEFLFISKGSLSYSPDDNFVHLDRFQNVILSNKLHATNSFVFQKNVEVKANLIQINKKEFRKKSSNHISSLQDSIVSLFSLDEPDKAFLHLGNYNIRIADYIKALHNFSETGMIKFLTVEGQLNLILAMQLLEHRNFENKEILPESLSKSDLKKIHKLADYIVDNISYPISIEVLSKEAGINPKRLQLGFQLLYNKSVNEYVRQLKLEMSRDLLKNSDLSISEIVYSIGYKSRSYFSKRFSEHYKILPTEYRNKIKSQLNIN